MVTRKVKFKKIKNKDQYRLGQTLYDRIFNRREFKKLYQLHKDIDFLTYCFYDIKDEEKTLKNLETYMEYDLMLFYKLNEIKYENDHGFERLISHLKQKRAKFINLHEKLRIYDFSEVKWKYNGT